MLPVYFHNEINTIYTFKKPECEGFAKALLDLKASGRARTMVSPIY